LSDEEKRANDGIGDIGVKARRKLKKMTVGINDVLELAAEQEDSLSFGLAVFSQKKNCGSGLCL